MSCSIALGKGRLWCVEWLLQEEKVRDTCIRATIPWQEKEKDKKDKADKPKSKELTNGKGGTPGAKDGHDEKKREKDKVREGEKVKDKDALREKDRKEKQREKDKEKDKEKPKEKESCAFFMSVRVRARVVRLGFWLRLGAIRQERKKERRATDEARCALRPLSKDICTAWHYYAKLSV